ncbi:hypothetical protein K456DRAFT_728041 [Colletotrichum gloeosporioides 23]|nr:hypothetical protein K456DRAFT_728041 [Colletotrichum gloeosporioides 23]
MISSHPPLAAPKTHDPDPEPGPGTPPRPTPDCDLRPGSPGGPCQGAASAIRCAGSTRSQPLMPTSDEALFCFVLVSRLREKAPPKTTMALLSPQQDLKDSQPAMSCCACACSCLSSALPHAPHPQIDLAPADLYSASSCCHSNQSSCSIITSKSGFSSTSSSSALHLLDRHPAPKRLASRISIARPPHPRLVRTRHPTRTLVRSIVAVPVHLFGGKLDKGHMDRRPRPLLIYLTSRPSSPGVGVSLFSPLQLILISSSSSARTLQTPDEKEIHNTASTQCSSQYT